MRIKNYLFLYLILVFLLPKITQADVPPPPVNQFIGRYDAFFDVLTQSICRGCHGVSLADRHHTLVVTDNKQCLDCHRVVWDPVKQSYTMAEFRDCVTCHTGSPHHTTKWALGDPIGNDDPSMGTVYGQCAYCHGNVVNNMLDGHYVPTYNTTMITPDPTDWVKSIYINY